MEDIEDGLFVCVDGWGEGYISVHPTIGGFFICVVFVNAESGRAGHVNDSPDGDEFMF